MIYKCDFCNKPITDKTHSYTKWQMRYGLCIKHQNQACIDRLDNPTYINGVKVKPNKDLTEEKIDKANKNKRRDEKGEDLDGNTQREIWSGF